MKKKLARADGISALPLPIGDSCGRCCPLRRGRFAHSDNGSDRGANKGGLLGAAEHKTDESTESCSSGDLWRVLHDMVDRIAVGIHPIEVSRVAATEVANMETTTAGIAISPISSLSDG